MKFWWNIYIIKWYRCELGKFSFFTGNLATWVDICFAVAVKLISHVQLFAAPWTAAHQASLFSTISWSLLKFRSFESVMLSKHLTLCHPLLPLPQYFLASECFSVIWPFLSGGQSIGVSASASVLPVNIQDWSPLGWTGWISLLSEGLSSLLQHHSSALSLLYGPDLTSIHDYWKNHSCHYKDLCWQSDISTFKYAV